MNKPIIDYLNNEFKPDSFEDYVINGLSVGNSGKISRIGAAVDSGIETFCEAKKREVDFLITHHGLLPSDYSMPIKGILYEKIKLLTSNDIAYYSLHMPLDVNSTFSNNRCFLDAMEWDISGTFAQYNDHDIGLYTEFSEAINIEQIIDKLSAVYNKEPVIWAFGDYLVKSAGIISGNGIKFLDHAVESGIDLLITGEMSHKMYWQAYEKGIKCIFLGHYATETSGIDKLGKYLAENFNLDYTFIDLPTGT